MTRQELEIMVRVRLSPDLADQLLRPWTSEDEER